jgi:hypothetical protein
VSSSEFGRGSGGEISLITKHANRLSGSLGLSTAHSSLFGNDAGKRLAATLGGTVVKDRLWFFAAAEQGDSFFRTPVSPAVSGNNSVDATSQAIDAKLGAQLGSRQNLNATFSSRDGRADFFAPRSSNFLSMHYTGIVSSNMFFTANVTRSSTSGTNTSLINVLP